MLDGSDLYLVAVHQQGLGDGRLFSLVTSVPVDRSVMDMIADGLGRVHLFVEPWNVASARTAEFAGFRREATLRGWERIDGAQKDADCYAQLHSEWAPG